MEISREQMVEKIQGTWNELIKNDMMTPRSIEISGNKANLRNFFNMKNSEWYEFRLEEDPGLVDQSHPGFKMMITKENGSDLEFVLYIDSFEDKTFPIICSRSFVADMGMMLMGEWVQEDVFPTLYSNGYKSVLQCKYSGRSGMMANHHEPMPMGMMGQGMMGGMAAFQGMMNMNMPAAPAAPANDEARFCPACGYKNSSTSKFCGECGNRL